MKFTLAITTFALALLAARTDAAETKAEDVLGRADQRYAGETDEVPSFRRHMVPLLGKLGCNGRACHGSFQGQGGFQLSLFGYDFEMDHAGLAESDEPRVDPSFAENSLAILKPTLEMPHRGGKRMDEGSWEYNLFVRWIESGAKNVAEGDPDLVRLDVTPSEIRFAREGETTQLQVVAVWSDGSREDVTPLSRFTSNGTAQATVDANGLVTSVEPGDTHVVVFYDNGVLPVPVLQPVSNEVGPEYPSVPTPTKVDELVVEKLRKLGIVPSDLATDAEFLRRVGLDLTGTLPAPAEIEAFLADDRPDKRARKIDELLETPAYSAWWATKICDWTGNNENFLNNVTPVRGQASTGWYQWVERRVAGNTPYDEIVEGILLADSRDPGESFADYCQSMCDISTGKADFADRESMPYYWTRRNLRQPEERVIGFAYTFLATRIQCAQCHKHPFDQWTKDDFEDFKGFFTSTSYGTNPETRGEYNAMVKELGVEGLRGNAQRRKFAELMKDGQIVPFQELYTGRPRNQSVAAAKRQVNQVERQIAVAGKRIDTLKKAGKDAEANKVKVDLDRMQRRLVVVRQRVRQAGAKARLLGGDVVDLSKVEDVRVPLMNWLRDEPRFAKAFVNRVWSGYFNVGIVEPTDDLSLANPPSNAPLLDHLAEGFVAHDFDMKWLHREIANSRTYQLGWVPNETNRRDERNFSHAIPRRLPAEVAVDALVAATASDEGIAKLHASVDGRAIALASPQRNNTDYSLSIFGRNTRESNCDCDRSMEASLLQTVFLRNDDEVYRMIDRRGDGWVFSVARDLGARFPGAPAANDVSDRQRERALARIASEVKKAGALRKAGKDSQAKALEARIAAARKRFAPRQVDEPAAGEKLADLDADAIVRDAYLRTLSRPPRPEEVDRAKQYLTDADDTIGGIRDLMWALLNTKEFIVNH